MRAVWLISGAVACAAVAAACGPFLIWRAQKIATLDTARRLPRPDLVWVGEGRCRLLLIGDSRIAQWPLKPVPGWTMAKAGFSGETAIAIARMAPALIAKADPDAVLIQAGINDAVAAALLLRPGERERTYRRTTAALSALTTEAAGGGRTAIVMTVVPPIRPALARRTILGDRPARYVARLNADLRRRSASGLVVIDADRLLRDPAGSLDHKVRRDDLHWNEVGYARLDAALATVLHSVTCRT